MAVEEQDSVSSGEINFSVKNPFTHIERVKNVFIERGEITEGKRGIYVVHDGGNNWWEFSLSHSDEDPQQVTLIVESNNAYLLNVIRDEVSALLSQ